MNEQIQTDSEELIAEIARYLAAVDVFRAERCEPRWLPELAPCRTPDECSQARATYVSPAH